MITLSGEIAELMAATVRLGFYHGLVHLWPLIAVHLDAGHVAGAVAVSRQIPQYRAVPCSPATSSRRWRKRARPGTRASPGWPGSRLAAAVALARDLNYC